MLFSTGGSEIRPYRFCPRARGTGYQGGRCAVGDVGTQVVIPRQSFTPGSVGPHLRGGRYLGENLVPPAMLVLDGRLGDPPLPVFIAGRGGRDIKADAPVVIDVGTQVVIPRPSFTPGSVGPHLRGGRYPGEKPSSASHAVLAGRFGRAASPRRPVSR